MTTEEKTLMAILTTVALLVPVGLGAMLGWPAWSWLLLGIVMLTFPGLVVRNIQIRVRREQFQQGYIEPPVQVQQHQVQHTQITDVALPSSVTDYYFRFSAATYWRPLGSRTTEHANIDGLATDTIVTRAQRITSVEQPSNVDVLQHRLASALGAVQRDASDTVETWAEHVQLKLPETDQVRLRKLADTRKDEDIWEHERIHERRKRAYLSEDVLKTTGSAVVWWLAQKDNDVERTVPLLGALAQLSAVANDARVPEQFRNLAPTTTLPHQHPFDPMVDQQHPDDQFHNGSRNAPGLPGFDIPAESLTDTRSVASQLAILMDTLDLNDDQRALFAHRFAQLIEKAGESVEAERIRNLFDTPTIDKGPVDTPARDVDPQGPPAPNMEQHGGSWGDDPPSEDSDQDDQAHIDAHLRPKPHVTD